MAVPKVEISLWRSDAIVLFDWLYRPEALARLVGDDRAVRQALMDLLTAIEMCTDIDYGASGGGLTQQDIELARAEVTKGMTP